jgi:CheY-like chemotaxis protein
MYKESVMAAKSILLVEDNPDNIELTLRAFRKSNTRHEVIVAHDGTEALDYVFGRGVYAGRDLNDMPAIILLDLQLPTINGFEVLRQVRTDERTKLLPVVILTTSGEREDIVRSYALGANSYVCKPVDFKQFIDLIQQLVSYWLILNENPTGWGI